MNALILKLYGKKHFTFTIPETNGEIARIKLLLYVNVLLITNSLDCLKNNALIVSIYNKFFNI